MKKFILFALIVLVLQSLVILPISAEDAAVIYAENFNKVSSYEELGYVKNEGFKPNTAKYSIADGALQIDNLDASVGTSGDSYITILDSAAVAPYVKGDYTIQYDLTYQAAEGADRYCVMIYNYDGADTYCTNHIRFRGTGNNEVRVAGEFKNFMEGSSVTWYDTTAENCILTRLTGLPYDDGVNNTLAGKTLTIRIQVDADKGPLVYVNGQLMPEPTALPAWGADAFKSYAIGLKTSKKIKATVDNIAVWTGLGDCPVDFNTLGEEAPAANADNTADTLGLAFVGMISALLAAYAVSRKNR